jgi:cell division protein FtsQ
MSGKARGGGQRSKAKGKPAAGGRGRSGDRGGGAQALPEAVRRLSAWALMAMLALLAVTAMLVLRVPQMIGGTLGEAAGEGGFALKRVEIKGARHIPQLEVYNIAFDQPSAAMPLIDLEATRQRLLRFGWVRDARVSRRLPDTLVVDIVERRPAAIWQYNSRLSLIDRDGVVLAPVRLEAMPDLPLLIGAGANHQAAALSRLVETAPQLKAAMSGASWVGGRRWDIRFQSGEVLALPEGDAEAARALTRFVKLDQSMQILGRGFVRVDMRVPGKCILRVSNEPGSSVPSIAPTAPPQAAPSAPPPAAAHPSAPASKRDDGAVDATKTI